MNLHVHELERRRAVMQRFQSECEVDGDIRNARRFAQLVEDLDRMIQQFRMLFLADPDPKASFVIRKVDEV